MDIALQFVLGIMLLSEWLVLFLILLVPFLLGVGSTLFAQWFVRARVWQRATRGRWI